MSTQRDDLKALFNKYCDWQSQNNRGTQIGIYSIAFIGLTVALRRVRPFTQFSKPQDIPNSYIRKRREIVGHVTRIEPSEALLMVKHTPIVNVPFLRKNHGELPVKIANVDINNLGINWLQVIAAGNQKKQQFVDLGESLCSIGFGKFEERPKKVNDIMHKIYIDRIKYAEELYIKREMGIHYYVEHTKSLLVTIVRLFVQYGFIKLYNQLKIRLPMTAKTNKKAIKATSKEKLNKSLNVSG